MSAECGLCSQPTEQECGHCGHPVCDPDDGGSCSYHADEKQAELLECEENIILCETCVAEADELEEQEDEEDEDEDEDEDDE